MKKYSLFLLVLVAVLSFCGCNATENDDSSEGTVSTEDVVSTEELIVTENDDSTSGTTSTEDVISTEELIVTENGVTYLKDPAKTLEITCGYFDNVEDDVERKEFKIKDSAFYNKLKKVINGKEVCDYFCLCTGDYQVGLNDNYSLYLHPDRITVNINLNGYSCFTVECSQEEMKELYDYIESKK